MTAYLLASQGASIPFAWEKAALVAWPMPEGPGQPLAPSLLSVLVLGVGVLLAWTGSPVFQDFLSSKSLCF